MKVSDVVNLPYTYDVNTELQRVLKETREVQVKVCAASSDSQRELLTKPDQRFQPNLSFVPTASRG